MNDRVEIPERILSALQDPASEMRSVTLSTKSRKWEACIEFTYGVLWHGGLADTPTEAFGNLVAQMTRK